jgi:hypothetical protein
MGIVLVTKGIQSKRKKLINDVQLRADIRRANQNTARDIRRELEKTTQTWDHEVKFQQITNVGEWAEVLIGTDDKIWKWLDQGTRVRYAHMTSDFEAKTTPDWVGSRPGKGGVAFIDTRHPLPGIKARNWSTILTQKHMPKHKKRVQDAMRRAARGT